MGDERTWENLIEEQSCLFRKTTERNKELETRVATLERELTVWKLAFASYEEEKEALQKKVTRLKRSIGSLKDDNPLVLCLIDGDGNIFSPDLILQGKQGGHHAAHLLTKGIMDYLLEKDMNSDATSSIMGRAQLWVAVYLNKSGLQDTLTARQICMPEQFETFIIGFNQASPLFSIFDVGYGKEAADTKIKEYLRVFTRFPQTCRVFFGGGHDNGYASILNFLNNEGILDKLVLLKGYHDIAYELKALNLPLIQIPNLFLTQRLPSMHQKKLSIPPPVPIMEKRILKFVKKPKGRKEASASVFIGRYDPTPCNFYYLAMCKAGSSCRFGHNYTLDPEELHVMRVHAKLIPCGYINRNRECPFGEGCPLGHVCPAGIQCKYLKQRRCKFAGDTMHIESTGNLEDSNQPSLLERISNSEGLSTRSSSSGAERTMSLDTEDELCSNFEF